jgi:hypothetical protein
MGTPGDPGITPESGHDGDSSAYDVDVGEVVDEDESVGEEDAELEEAPQAGCLLCGAEPDGTRPLPLCAPCRQHSLHRKFPAWIKLAAVLIAIPVAIAAIQFPKNLSAAVAYHRGQADEALGYNALAVQEYEKAGQRFPKSTIVKARQGIAAYHAGFYDITERDFNAIAGKEAPSAEIADEVNAIMDEIDQTSEQSGQQKQEQ